jgi:hypothetical protein
MSHRIIFLVSARSGSHLLGQLLSGDIFLNLEEKVDDHQILTTPAGLCPLYTPGYSGDRNILFRRPVNTPFDSFIDYVADGPAEYDLDNLEIGLEWNPEQISYISSLTDKCTFFQLIRDGRNQVASLKALEEGYSNSNWNLDHFKSIVLTFKYRAKSILERESLFENFHILKFEDLVFDPVVILSKIKFLAEVPLDYSAIEDTIKNISPNSSYWNVGELFERSDTNFRWKGLTVLERKVFHEIAGEELLRLGYIDDNSWIYKE